MEKERNYNILRGCVLASGLERETKTELLTFLSKLESHEKYTTGGTNEPA